MKQRVTGKNGVNRGEGIRRPLQSRSAENLTSSLSPTAGLVSGHALMAQTNVGRSRSAHELVTHTPIDRELQSPDATRYSKHKRLAHAGARFRSRSREPPAVERVLNEEERELVVDRMHREFLGRRKGLLNGLPAGCSQEEVDSFLEMYFCKTVSKIKDRSVRILFPTSEVASDQLQRLNSARYEGCRLSATYGHPDSLLFVGNLSCTYSHEDLLWLFQPHGDILRCFVVCSLSTGLSKGYGFVEFSSRDEAAEAKLHLATKVVGQRSLRVDFADNGMQTVDDLHSRTLFVDRLPKGFVDDDVLRDKFSAYGIVNFCQVAVMSSGVSRGFAFIDMSMWKEAESAQENCNGAVLSGHEIRVSFGMPCRPGACILQHKNSISIPFISGRPLTPALHLCQKENLPLGDFTPHPPHPPSLKFSVPPMTSRPYKPHPHQLDVTRPEFIPNPSFTLHGTLPPSSALARSSSAPDVSSLPPSLLPYKAANSPSPPPSSSCSDSPPSHTPPAIDDEEENKHNTLCRTPPYREARLPANEQSIRQRVSRKRCAPLLDAAVDTGLMAVYDRPYIGQHQQGIPFTHPLKRIKTFVY